MNIHIGNVEVDGVPYAARQRLTVGIWATLYTNGRIAVHLSTKRGEPWARASVNLPTTKLNQGEFAFDAPHLKDAAEDLMNSGFFKSTGRYVMSGYNSYPIWELLDQEAINYLVEDFQRSNP